MSYAERMRQAQREIIVRYLRAARGKVSRAASAAKLNRQHFYKIMTRHGITPPGHVNQGNEAWKALR